MSKKGTINAQQFNLIVGNILALYSKYLEIPENEIMKKINQFNQQLDNQIKENEKSLQQRENDELAS